MDRTTRPKSQGCSWEGVRTVALENTAIKMVFIVNKALQYAVFPLSTSSAILRCK